MMIAVQKIRFMSRLVTLFLSFAFSTVALAEVYEVILPPAISYGDSVVVGVPGMVVNGVTISTAGNALVTQMACQEYNVMFGWETRYTYWVMQYLSISISSGDCWLGTEQWFVSGEFSLDNIALSLLPSCLVSVPDNSFNVSIFVGGDPSNTSCNEPGADNYRRTVVEAGELVFNSDLVLRFDVTLPVANEGHTWGYLKATYR